VSFVLETTAEVAANRQVSLRKFDRGVDEWTADVAYRTSAATVQFLALARSLGHARRSSFTRPEDRRGPEPQRPSQQAQRDVHRAVDLIDAGPEQALRVAGRPRDARAGNGLDRRRRRADEAVRARILAHAPDLTIGANSVRLDGMTYRIHLDVHDAARHHAAGDLSIQASAGRLVPPIEIHGVRGWVTGYVVPVMSGRLDGSIDVDGITVPLSGGTGYHDHNWGFWEGVSWQWGQVQQGDLSLIYGRVFPPAEAADPEQFPGFVGALGPDGPLGYATDVHIAETNGDHEQPRTVTVRARGPGIDLNMRFDVSSAVVTHMAQGPLASGVDFLQLRGQYTVSGRAGGRTLDFRAPGAAETFRGGR